MDDEMIEMDRFFGGDPGIAAEARKYFQALHDKRISRAPEPININDIPERSRKVMTQILKEMKPNVTVRAQKAAELKGENDPASLSPQDLMAVVTVIEEDKKMLDYLDKKEGA